MLLVRAPASDATAATADVGIVMDEASFGGTETSTGFKPLSETVENAINDQQDRGDTQIGHGQGAVAGQHLHVDEWAAFGAE